MNDLDEIDRILNRKDQILPSSGFASAVMDAVRREATAPAPIPFPWKRALPGVIAGGLVLVFIAIALTAVSAHPESAGSSSQVSTFYMPSSTLTPLQQDLKLAALWTIAGLLAAWVSVKLSMRLPPSGI